MYGCHGVHFKVVWEQYYAHQYNPIQYRYNTSNALNLRPFSGKPIRMLWCWKISIWPWWSYLGYKLDYDIINCTLKFVLFSLKTPAGAPIACMMSSGAFSTGSVPCCWGLSALISARFGKRKKFESVSPVWVFHPSFSLMVIFSTIHICVVYTWRHCSCGNNQVHYSSLGDGLLVL